MGKIVAQIPNEDPERLKRVLDAKWRTIGVDKDALELQVQERKQREAEDAEKERAWAQLANYYDDQLTLQQQEADRLRRTYNKDLQDYRQNNQLQHTRKEWDLNRPDHKLIDSAGRVGDDDPRIGAASMQKFDGEDLSAGDRKAAQIEQAKTWWETQAAQKAAMKAAEAEQEQAYAELTKYQDLVQLSAKNQEADMRKEMNRTTADINRQLAEEKRLREEREKMANLAANMAELDASLNSPLMTEDPNLAASALSAYRVRKDHYKGMTEAERKAVLDAQLAQMEENKARRAAQQLEEAMYARTQHDIQRAMAEQARQVDDFRKNQMAKAQDVLKKQMEEKANRDKDLKDLYQNQIHDSFFQQFGTSHR
mmetsp:Transcript_39826/g.88539  ORF Transcript_39826/g.88539 Transcript_39826/m.88539 type:complete len:368 (-) Transcript_39826:472-1575(-)